MADQVMVEMPLQLTPELIKAVRERPMTRAESTQEWHRNLGWLVCAYGVLLEAQMGVNANG